jgi:murein DD-endopeptidase MepM/ murein hydrolase activator NlpD
MVLKKGVVYYSFPGRATLPPHQVVLNPPPSPAFLPKTQTRAFILETDRAENLWPWLMKTVSRMQSNYPPKAISAKGIPGLTQLQFEKANNLQNDNQVNMWLTPRYLGGLWAKLGSLALLLHKSGFRPLAHQQTRLPLHEAQAMVREACLNFLAYAQEQQCAGGQNPQRSIRFQEPNQSGYCFPVAYPFSFRDSWGEARRGGRQHRAADIFASEGTEVYAATAGVIDTLATFPEAGITLILRGQDGKGYGYMHLQGYAEGIVAGKEVKSGELLGYVGRTGVQQSGAHLHFQVYADHRLAKDALLNPYDFLVQLCHGNGVTDLYHHKVAQVYENPEIPIKEIPVKAIQVSRRPTLRVRSSQIRVKEPAIVVIRNF